MFNAFPLDGVSPMPTPYCWSPQKTWVELAAEDLYCRAVDLRLCRQEKDGVEHLWWERIAVDDTQ